MMKIVCAITRPASGETKNYAKGTMSVTSPGRPLTFWFLKNSVDPSVSAG
ncbi:MAG TPA: hypothetical protein VFJ51_11580 [Nitrososphaeraceae archaeon]|nr:hypothetical protein [Nitrososphaeraceae archaeon]